MATGTESDPTHDSSDAGNARHSDLLGLPWHWHRVRELRAVMASGVIAAVVRDVAIDLGGDWRVVIPLLATFVIYLFFASWPLQAYRHTATRILSGWAGFFLAAVAYQELIRRVHYRPLLGFLWYYCIFMSPAILNLIVALIVVFVRRRAWPIYPVGHCRKCGYNLFGLDSTRCPECGLPFGGEIRQ
jgi:hypothetical protein